MVHGFDILFKSGTISQVELITWSFYEARVALIIGLIGYWSSKLRLNLIDGASSTFDRQNLAFS